VAFSATFYVKWDSVNNGPGNDLGHAYHTIAQAITAASNGDTIYVYGVHSYVESLDFTKQLTVTGVNSPTIDASSSGYGVVVSVPTTLQNFTIVGGHFNAISVKNAASGTVIKSCTINVYTYGKGIYLGYDGTPSSISARIDNNVISGGSWKSEGIFGGIISMGGSSLITSNLIKNGALGIFLSGSGTPFIYNNTIVNNHNVVIGLGQGPTRGGGIYVVGGLSNICMPYIENNIFANNSADLGGAYYFDEEHNGAFTDISNTTFYGNTSVESSSAYYPALSHWPTIGFDGNNEDNPLFLTGTDYRLQATSTCIGSGSNTYDGGECNWRDLVGLPRRIGTTVDRGCYEGASALTNTRTVGDWVELRDKVVTGNFGDRFYTEETNRVFGTKIAATSLVAAGDLVTVDGQYAMVNNELTLQSSFVTSTTGSPSNIPAPLGMNNKAIGGINVGLLIRTWGKITDVASGIYTIDDGSEVNTQVVWSGTPYAVNDYIAVTGVSCYGRVRATSIDYITTIEEQQLRMAPGMESSMSMSVSNTDQKMASLLAWKEFVEEQIASLDAKAPLTASQQDWRAFMQTWLTQVNAKIAALETSQETR
jgi:parallel beta-helix repeat protein